jgi:tripartite-type tricarboxylate transporter receptor subunit TctC
MWRAGSLRILGVCGDRRSIAMPDVPTLIEPGYKSINATDFIGFYLPRGAAGSVAQTAHTALERVLPTPPVLKAMEDMGIEPAFSTPAELAQLVKTETERWGPIVKQIGFIADP